MKKILLSLGLLSFALSKPAQAHKEWVHQYMVQQAYLFLENQVGPIPVLKQAAGIDLYGPGRHYHGSGTQLNYTLPQISLGAWREDVDDWIYGYGDGFTNGVTPSITHFWRADAGDDERSVSLNNDKHYENAWEKARIFLFCNNSRGGTYYVTVPFSDGYITRNYIITYNSLPDLYKGDYFIEGVSDISGYNYVPMNHSPTHYPAFGQPVALQILGRVAHLLGDMSVPAHAHAHLHPCPARVTDFYENNMGNVFWDSDHPNTDCEEDPYPNDGNYRAKQWTAATAAQKGGLIQQAYCQSTPLAFMRYLFYTTNQLADFFPSGETVSQRNDLAGPAYVTSTYNYPAYYPDLNYLVNGNNNLPNTTDAAANADLQALYSPMIASYGVSPSDIVYEDIARETFNYSIRSVATLFQWFAYNSGLTPTLDNSNAIVGSSSALCPSSQPVAFTLQNNLGSSTVSSWSVQPAYAATGVAVNSNQTYIVTPTADTRQGPVTVSVTYASRYGSNGCYTYPVTLTKTIWKGAPGVLVSNYYDSNIYTVDPGTTIALQGLGPGYIPDNNTSFTWTSNNGSSITGSGSSAALYAPFDYGTAFTGTVTATNACGTTTASLSFRTRDEHPPRCLGCPEETYLTSGTPASTSATNPASPPDVSAGVTTLQNKFLSASLPSGFEVSPNPSSGSFDLYYVSAEQTTATAHGVPSFVVIDVLGRTVAQGPLPTPTTHIVTSQWSEGIYLLKILDAGKVLHKKLQVNR